MQEVDDDNIRQAEARQVREYRKKINKREKKERESMQKAKLKDNKEQDGMTRRS